MKHAILSDIHSNFFALKPVLSDIKKNNINSIIIAGDIFGYYPWACETFEILHPLLQNAECIKGNHDQLLLDLNPPHPVPAYWQAAKQNERELSSGFHIAIDWLKSLDFSKSFILGSRQFTLVHGTPNDPGNGRFFPDNDQDYTWFPKKNEVLVMGHTHYPIIKQLPSGGIILNPGSVGQPRDGNPMPCWILLDDSNFDCTLMRTQYDNLHTMSLLTSMQWDERSIIALNKRHKGPL